MMLLTKTQQQQQQQQKQKIAEGANDGSENEDGSILPDDFDFLSQIDLAFPLSALSRSHDGSENTMTPITTSILTLLGYRTCNRHKKTQNKRQIHPLVAVHTDVGVITMLLFDGGSANDTCGILQRKVRDSDPIDEDSSSDGQMSYYQRIFLTILSL
mmetsp:Transcript_24052/g.56876  ORF Transcript_24052/g.56876 Transcript_24052/m.56876 type:complete len:157 (+) Transcript_24052:11-481(+)